MKKYAFPQEARTFILAVIYLIFAAYSLYIIIVSETMAQKLLFGLLFLVILGVALYAEYLKKLYRKAIQTIAYDACPQQGLKQYEELLQKDIFKSYRHPKAVYDTLYFSDMLEPEKLLETLNENYKYFHQNIDNLLIWHYNQFYANFLLGNSTKVKEEYSKITRMKDAKIKGHKLSPIYNWEFIDALYQFSKKNYKQSFNTFSQVYTQNMNTREKLHYYYQFAQLCKVMHNKEKEQECRQNILKIHGTSKIIEVIQHENE